MNHNSIDIADWEVEITAIRSQGSGGQNVNKVASAIHLRYDIRRSKLPELYKQRLLKLSDSRITKTGSIIIKSQQHRTQEKNREEAMHRLKELIASVMVTQKNRRPTKATYGSKQRRMDKKTERSKTKGLRGRIDY
ncbi:MAG: alternative ribosome rescue aminoacyl-tRNA hydrolase ArfB [Fibrobacterales bacterium]